MPLKATMYLLLCSAIFSACQQVHYQVVTTGHEGQSAPDLAFISHDSTKVTHPFSHTVQAPTVLFYFNPTCQYCQRELVDIRKHIDLLKSFNIYLLTDHRSDVLNQFYKFYHLNEYPNISVDLDYKKDFKDYFNPQSVPFTAVYCPKGTLQKVFEGQVDSKKIFETAQN